MRIALVSPGYPPTPGGVEVVVAHTARALARAGAQVEVLADERRRDLPRLSEDHGVLVRRFACNQAENYRFAPGLWSYLAAHGRDYDVIHAHSYHAPAAVGAALVLRAGHARTPFVFTPHYHGSGHSRTRAALHHAYRPVGRLALDFARAVVCVSRAEAKLVEDHFPAVRGRTVVVPNAVDVAAVRGARPFPGEPSTVLGVGRLEAYKRFDLLIEAFARLVLIGAPPSSPAPSSPAPSSPAPSPPAPSPAQSSLAGATGDTQLVIIGDGPDRGRMKDTAARLGVEERARFLGRVNDEELHRWLCTAGVLCSLSEHEAYGLAPAEALVAGTRVVLSAIPAHLELAATGAAGAVELVEADSADVAHALGSALAAVPTTGVDAASAAPSLGVGVLDWDAVAAALLEVYRTVMPAGRRVRA